MILRVVLGCVAEAVGRLAAQRLTPRACKRACGAPRRQLQGLANWRRLAPAAPFFLAPSLILRSELLLSERKQQRLSNCLSDRPTNSCSIAARACGAELYFFVILSNDRVVFMLRRSYSLLDSQKLGSLVFDATWIFEKSCARLTWPPSQRR